MSRNTLIGIGVVVFIIGVLIPLLILPLHRPSLSEREAEKPILIEGPKTPSIRVVLTSSHLEAYRDLIEKVLAQAKLTTYSLRGGFILESIPSLTVSPLYSESETVRVLPLALTTSPTSQPEYSLTNVQVSGVDEEDVVKTNGYLISIARENGVAIIDANEKRVLSYINTTNVKGLYLLDNTLIAIRVDLSLEATVPIGESSQYTVKYPLIDILVYDLSQPSSPVLLYQVNVTCKFGGSRLIGKYLYVVGYLESFNYIDKDTVIPLIPIVNGRLIPRESIIETGNYTSYIVILALDALSGEYTVNAYTGGRVDWIYMVQDRLYVAWSSDFTYYKAILGLLEYLESKGVISRFKLEELRLMFKQGALDRVMDELQRIVKDLGDYGVLSEEVNVTDETFFLVLSISGLRVSERGVFRVPGVVLDQFAMEELHSERGRFLVVATTVHSYSLRVIVGRLVNYTYMPIVVTLVGNNVTTTITVTATLSQQISADYTWFILVLSSSSSNSVYVIDENLSVVSKLENLAPNERVYAARLVKNIFYLVTFRLVDPLFAIDLLDPYNPRVLGYLKIPGFSEYLHPLSENLLLGVGLENRWLKISMFNVTDPVNMSEIVKLVITNCFWSEVFKNHRAFMVNTRHSIVALPVTTYVNNQGAIITGFLIVGYSADNASLRVLSMIELERPMRALYINSELYLVGYNRVLVYKLPSLELTGEIKY